MKKRAGFTLIEVVAAIAVASLILAATYGVVITTLSSRKRAEEVLGVYKEGSAILTLVCEDLRSALYRLKAQNFNADSESEPGSFSFASIAWNPQGGRVSTGEISYELERDGDRLSLFRRFAMIEGDLAKGGTYTLVSDSIVSWKIEYLDKEGWVKAWEIGESLPLAVAVEFTLEDGERDPVLFRRQAALPASDLVELITISEVSG